MEWYIEFDFSLVQDGIYVLRKVHMHSTLSLRSFPSVAIETVPVLVWVKMAWWFTMFGFNTDEFALEFKKFESVAFILLWLDVANVQMITAMLGIMKTKQ